MSQKQAVLPARLIERTLGDLKVGESVWVVPWMLHVDDRRRCWIDPAATFCMERGGTVQMRVTRKPDGLHVDIPRGERFRMGGPAPDGLVSVVSI